MKCPVTLLLLVVLGTVVTACKPGKNGDPSPGAAPSAPVSVVSAPYAADIRAFCDGPNDPKVMRLKRGDAGSMTMDPSQLVRFCAEIVQPRLTTDEGKKFFKSLSSERIPPAEKAAKLREQAKLSGLSTCAFADIWDPPHP